MLEGLVQWPQHLLLETPGPVGSTQGSVSMCHSRSLPLVWFLPLTLPFCTTTPAARWASCSLWAPDRCLQEGFYGNQGQEKPAHQVQCYNVRDRRAGRGVIPSKAEASVWWHGQGKVFHLLHLSWDKERLTQHSPALFPSTVVNSLIMGFFLSHMPDILVWLLHSRLGQQWLCMQWRLIMAMGNPYSQAWGTEDGFGAQAMRSMADVPCGDCIPYKSHWKQG